MHLNEYQSAAMATCLDASKNVPYMALGLAGEAGEVANKAKKIIRDGAGTLTDARRQDIADELGDVLWYCAGVATVLGVSLEVIAHNNLAKLAARHDAGKIVGSGDHR